MDSELCMIKDIFNECVKEISHLLKNYNTHANEVDHLVNPSGDNVDNLDLVTNNIFINKFKSAPGVKCLISEEDEEMIHCKFYKTGKYIVCFDPLDGSSNIKSNITIGSIMAVYEYKEHLTGHDIVFSAFSLYGTSVCVVNADKYNLGYNVDQLIHDKFVSVKSHELIPNNSKMFSINISNKNRWINKNIDPYINHLIDTGSNMRWVASMVGDVYRLLLQGGVFIYPNDSKSPNGKLRLLYEVNPLGFIIQQAGGTEQDENSLSNLDKEIDYENIHQKMSCMIGSHDCIQLYNNISNGKESE
jgi:fructose-1,6-bisphosphatase I